MKKKTFPKFGNGKGMKNLFPKFGNGKGIPFPLFGNGNQRLSFPGKYVASA